MMDIFNLLHTVFYFLLALGVLVTFHEYGHYWVAKRCGVTVERFSIGFGKVLIRWQKNGTEFAISAIPLGGYVKMRGDNGGTDTDSNDQQIDVDSNESLITSEQSDVETLKSFDNQPVLNRMAIVAAGPIANFILAFLFFWILTTGTKTAIAPVISYPVIDSAAFKAGLSQNDEIVAIDKEPTPTWNAVFKQLLQRVGDSGIIEIEARQFQSQQVTGTYQLAINNWLSDNQQLNPMTDLGLSLNVPEIEPRIKELVEGGSADRAGLKAGDEIFSVDGQSVNSWNQWRELVQSNPGKSLNVGLLRVVNENSETLYIDVVPDTKKEKGNAYGFVGVIPEVPTLPTNMKREISYNVLQALPVAVAETWNSIRFTLTSIKKIIFGQISVKTLGGPISIAKFAGDSASYGWQSFISLLAILSVSLGVLNLLPVPVLDGGRLVFYTYEALVGNPLATRIQESAMRVGVILIGMLMVFALYNDISRL